MHLKITTITTVLGLCLTMNSASQAAIISGWGAETSSTTASSCPSYCTGTFTYDNNGGDGFSTATSNLVNTHGEPKSQATLSGTTYLPILKAYAESFGGTGAFASATGVQGYTYTGASPKTISLDLSLDGTIDLSAGGTAEASLEGQVAVIFTNQLDFYTDFGTVVYEVAPPGSVAATSQVFGIATDQLTFTVNPGDDFFVWAGLQVDGMRGGIADAYNTFTMDFADDAGLQAASVSAIPAPAALWLFGSGLMGLIGVARRRKA